MNHLSDERAPHDPANLNAANTGREATGYLHALYCQSLSEFGTPRFLGESGAWILERPIPNYPGHDAMGCYPLFACKDWSRLDADLTNLENTLVSLAVVTDPFGEYDSAYLQHCFRDVVVPFKEHYVIDLSLPLDTFVHSHHRRNARKGRQEMEVERCANPGGYLDDWMALYDRLIERHHIRGIPAFSRESFERQLRVPGMVAFRAFRDNVTLGMLLWYAAWEKAYYHLGAYSLEGYNLRASFALFSYALEFFAAENFKWLHLGAGAGSEAGADSGLDRFKQGWSTGTRTAYFCGRIFDRQKYDELAMATGARSTAYFPAYRVGEFS